VRRGGPQQKWLAFVHNRREVITALDFFTVPTVTLRVLYCSFVIEHERREILHGNVTEHSHTGMDRATTVGGISGTLPLPLRHSGPGPKV
jgi:hypothetical protein